MTLFLFIMGGGVQRDLNGRGDDGWVNLDLNGVANDYWTRGGNALNTPPPEIAQAPPQQAKLTLLGHSWFLLAYIWLLKCLCVTSESERGNKCVALFYSLPSSNSEAFLCVQPISGLFLYISSLFSLHVFVCVFQTRCFHAVWHMYSIRIMQLMWAAVINTLLFCSHSADGSTSLSVTAGLQSFQTTVYLCVCVCV